MGARQSTQSTESNAQSALPCGSHPNEHATAEDAGGASSNYSGSHARVNAHSQAGSSSSHPSHHHRHRHHRHNHVRQLRSRSITAENPQIEDAAAIIAALRSQRRRTDQLGDAAAGGGPSDQSSDSGDDGDLGLTNSTIRSLDRLLRLNSETGAGANEGRGQSSRVWVPPISFRCFDIKCPVCNKIVPFDDVDYHFVICLTRPRIDYNEEILTEDRDECVICFDEMTQGDTIARLPCLCVYHKACIDGWFKVKNCCPAHPGDD